MSTADDPENLVGRLREAMAEEGEEINEVPPTDAPDVSGNLMEELREAISNLSTQVTSLSEVCAYLVEMEKFRETEKNASIRQEEIRELEMIMGEQCEEEQHNPRKRSWKFWKK